VKCEELSAKLHAAYWSTKDDPEARKIAHLVTHLKNVLGVLQNLKYLVSISGPRTDTDKEPTVNTFGSLHVDAATKYLAEIEATKSS
jgi:hypothetical protein